MEVVGEIVGTEIVGTDVGYDVTGAFVGLTEGIVVVGEVDG